MDECCVCVCVFLCLVASVTFDSFRPHGLSLYRLSVGFSRQEYWSRLPCPPDPGIEPVPFTSPAEAGGFFTTRATWEALWVCYHPYFI